MGRARSTLWSLSTFWINLKNRMFQIWLRRSERVEKRTVFTRKMPLTRRARHSALVRLRTSGARSSKRHVDVNELIQQELLLRKRSAVCCFGTCDSRERRRQRSGDQARDREGGQRDFNRLTSVWFIQRLPVLPKNVHTMSKS